MSATRMEMAMFVEHRTYQLHASSIDRYFETFGRSAFELQVAHGARCVGHYVTETGPLNQIVAIWQYKSFEQRLEDRRRLRQNSDWREIIGKVTPLIQNIETKILMPSPVWVGLSNE